MFTSIFAGIKALPLILCGVAGAVVAGGITWGICHMIISGKNSEITTLTAQVSEKETQLKTAIADAGRWQSAGEGYISTIRKMSAEAEKNRADLVRATETVKKNDRANEIAQEELNNTIRKLKEKRRANPDQVRPLGPIALDALCNVLRAPTGALPAGCPPPAGD